MRAFYFWFAVHGHALPVPDEKLVAVILDTPDEFKFQRAILEDEPLVSDGFFARRDDVCVFSAQRIDLAFQDFERQVQPIWQAGNLYEKSQLLDGTAKWRVSVTTGARVRANGNARPSGRRR